MGCRQGKMETANEDVKTDDVAAAAAGETGPAEDAPKVIVVFGATGAQGGSVVQYMKTDESFKLRIVTRNPDSEKAKALAEQGLEVVKGDLDDVESLKKAFEGAYGAFLVTSFFDSLDRDKDTETQQGKNAVDAAKEQKLKHLVFSGLENVLESLKKECRHFDSKAAIEKYIQDNDLPYTFVRYAFYYENLIKIMKPRKDDNGDFILDIPMGDAAFDMVCVAETGECIRQIFRQPSEYIGKAIGLSSQRFKVEEYAAIMTKAFEGKKIKAGTITVEEYAKLGFPAAEELAAMFEFLQTGKYDRDIEVTRKLNPAISPFEQWVDNNHDAIAAILE